MLIGQAQLPAVTKGDGMTRQDTTWNGDDDGALDSDRMGIVPSAASDWLAVDPMDDDEAGDEIVLTTRRRLMRLSIISAEVGARFAREGVAHDPMAWMLAPRRVFDGRVGIEACQELRGFGRGIVLHGLGLGLDADADFVDDLLLEGGLDDVPARADRLH